MEQNHNYEPFKIEMQVANIISSQAKHGVNFNGRNARWYIHVLNEYILNLDLELIPFLPKMRVDGTSYRKPFKANGDLSKFVQQYADRVGLTREDFGGPFTVVEYKDFDPSKDARVKEALMDMGFLPPEWNTTKKPWNVHEYKRDLLRMSYSNWLNTYSNHKEYKKRQIAAEVDEAVNKFIEKHFKNRTVNYMKAYLYGLGFNVKNKAPTFDLIKKKLALSDKWITAPTNLEETLDEGLGGEMGRVGEMLKKRVVASHRRGLIQGLIDKERADGKLSAEANSCATPTFRFKHRIVVNIPSRGFFGHECRSLFQSDVNLDEFHGKPVVLHNNIPSGCSIKPGTNIIVDDKKGKVVGVHRYYCPPQRELFLGYDGSGLELRMLAHYLISECRAMLSEAEAEGSEEKRSIAERGLASAIMYRDVLLDGDIHTHNQKLAGLPTRDNAKTFIYAFNYGAGNLKLGSIVNGGAEEGALMRERFLAENPCIAILIERITDKAKKGYIDGIDGRRITMRRDAQGNVMTHKALNTLLQSAGAIVMKYAMVFLDKWIKRDGIRCAKVIDMHDEGQFSVHREDVKKLEELTLLCVKKAGEYLKMECPLASDAKVGLNWLHTH